MEAGTTRWMQEQADTLPLETYHVTVTDIEALDHNRHQELETALQDLIEDALDTEPGGTVEHEALRSVHELLGETGEERWDAIDAALADAGLDTYREYADLVRGREERPFPSLMRVRFRQEDGEDQDRIDELGETYVRQQDVLEEGDHSSEDGDEGIRFLPGQHFGTRMRLSDPDAEKRHTKANAYSIANWDATGDEIELLIKRIPPNIADESSLTPRLFDDLSEGDELVVHGPYTDDLMLHTPSERDMVFMATGTGVAPLKSMIDYVFEEEWDRYEGQERNVWLFLGASWEDDLPYHETFQELDSEVDHFHYIPTCSREGALTDWDGATEYIQHELLSYVDDTSIPSEALDPEYTRHVERNPAYDVEARIDPAGTEFYLCGVSAMVASVRPVFEALDVPDEQWQAEPYG